MNKKKITATEVMALIEDIRGDFKVAMDGINSNNTEIKELKETVNKLVLRVEELKTKTDYHTEKLDYHTYQLGSIIEMVAKNTEDIYEIKQLLDNKADKKDFLDLKRIVLQSN